MFLKTLIKYSSSYTIRSPLDIKLFRSPQHLELIKKSLNSRYRDENIADNIASLLQHYKKKLFQFQQLSKSINQSQKSISQSLKTQTKSNQQTPTKDFTQQKKLKIQQLSQLKNKQKLMTTQIKQLLTKIQQQIMKVGNIVDKSTPISKDQANNQIINQYKPQLINTTHTTPYSQLCQKFGLTDLKRGQKVGGHRGYFLKGKGVKIALGLANYGIDFLQQRGYQPYYTPAIINQSTLRASCQLQSIEQDVYKLQKTDSYLIATSQQSLAGYYKDQVIQKTRLPIRMLGYSTCFRKQAGAHGKDIHGLFRVHQFQKVQQFTIVKPQQSEQQMKNMMDISQQFYQSLGIPYRVVNIVSGQLNDAAACKYDLQAWYPSQQRYRQLVSVSNCTQYQSRLLKIQMHGTNNQLIYPHMLNGTLIAIQRAFTCLIQNQFFKDIIIIPKVLQPYVGCEEIKLPVIKQ